MGILPLVVWIQRACQLRNSFSANRARVRPRSNSAGHAPKLFQLVRGSRRETIQGILRPLHRLSSSRIGLLPECGCHETAMFRQLSQSFALWMRNLTNSACANTGCSHEQSKCVKLDIAEVGPGGCARPFAPSVLFLSLKRTVGRGARPYLAEAVGAAGAAFFSSRYGCFCS
jgi:hypothetical protein